jgi:hypothetical protein
MLPIVTCILKKEILRRKLHTSGLFCFLELSVFRRLLDDDKSNGRTLFGDGMGATKESILHDRRLIHSID